MKNLIITLATLFSLTACEKEIDLNLENKSGQLIIEGNISDQLEPHLVRITRSVAFTEPNQYPAVSNALVTISDNTGLVDTLKYLSDGRKLPNQQAQSWRIWQNLYLAGLRGRKNLHRSV